MMTFLAVMSDLNGNGKSFNERTRKMESKDLRKEAYRRYEWIDPITGNAMMHEIKEPQSLHRGKTTARILDSNGLVHFVPAVGYFGCVLLTHNKDKSEPYYD